MSDSNATDFKRSMQQRHLVMLSLGGVIGTGLFLSSGYTIQQAGPAGAVLAYLIGGLVVYLVMMCLGELAVHHPEPGAFSAHATRYLGPATGYTVAWLYWLTWAVALGSEFTASAVFMGRWFPGVEPWIWCGIFSLIVFGMNIVSARFFAESEFWLSLIKVAAVIVFIAVGAAAMFGFTPLAGNVEAPGVTRILQEGVFDHGVMPILMTLLAVSFAFSGTELIGIAALLPQDSAGLKESPFVAVFQLTGIPYAADIMNFVIITALLSAANSGLYAASRMLWTLADQKTLPRVFSRVNQRGIPVPALLITMLGGLLSLLSSVYAEDTLYLALVSISGLAVVLVWMAIAASQFSFRRQWLKAGHSASELTYRAPLYPVVPIAAFLFCALACIGIAFDPNQRIALYFGVPFVALCYLVHYLTHRTSADAANSANPTPQEALDAR